MDKVYLLYTLDDYGISTVETFRGVYSTKKAAEVEGERLKESSYTKTVEYKVVKTTVKD